MEWPDNFDGEDEPFDEVLYTDEDAEELWLEFQLAMLRMRRGLKRLGAACEQAGAAFRVFADAYVLSQSEIDVGDSPPPPSDA